jgi:hypothetical protein
MANIDIPVSPKLKELLETPKCLDLTLPKAKVPSLKLPTGSTMKGLADVSKAIPTDCSVTFSLLLQIGPILASMDCLLKILKALGAIIDLVTNPPPTPGKIKKVLDAVANFGPCLAIPTGANLPFFIRDLLCLILKILKCAVDSLGSIAKIMQGLTLSLDTAAQEGNEDLIATLKCAQQNAQAQADSVLTSIEPLAVLLELASPVMDMAKVPPISFTAPGGAEGAEAIMSVVTVLQGVVEILETATDALGGCS